MAVYKNPFTIDLSVWTQNTFVHQFLRKKSHTKILGLTDKLVTCPPMVKEMLVK
jgi:hypothetical protein